MILFGKKVEIYQSRNYAEFKALKKILKKNGITYGSSWVETEVACGCGAKINMRNAVKKLGRGCSSDRGAVQKLKFLDSFLDVLYDV